VPAASRARGQPSATLNAAGSGSTTRRIVTPVSPWPTGGRPRRVALTGGRAHRGRRPASARGRAGHGHRRPIPAGVPHQRCRLALQGFQPNERMIMFENAAGATFESPGRPVVPARLGKAGNPLVAKAEFPRPDHRPAVQSPPSRCPSGRAASCCTSGRASVRPISPTRSTPTRDEPADHFVALLRQLVDEAGAAGCRYIQFDLPFYPRFVNERHRANWRARGFDDKSYLQRPACRSSGRGRPAHRWPDRTARVPRQRRRLLADPRVNRAGGRAAIHPARRQVLVG
jgi:hypothetical protein